MGFHLHHTIVVTCFNEKMIQEAHEKAKELGLCVSELTPGTSNDYQSFLIAPDGSKEGWDTSDEHNAKRTLYKEWFRSRRIYCDWVEIAFGGDEGGTLTQVIDHSQAGLDL